METTIKTPKISYLKHKRNLIELDKLKRPLPGNTRGSDE